jgi:hypothetical protein
MDARQGGDRTRAEIAGLDSARLVGLLKVLGRRGPFLSKQDENRIEMKLWFANSNWRGKGRYIQAKVPQTLISPFLQAPEHYIKLYRQSKFLSNRRNDQ